MLLLRLHPESPKKKVYSLLTAANLHPAHSDVLHDGEVEEDGLLAHHPDTLPHPTNVQTLGGTRGNYEPVINLDVFPIQLDVASVGVAYF